MQRFISFLVGPRVLPSGFSRWGRLGTLLFLGGWLLSCPAWAATPSWRVSGTGTWNAANWGGSLPTRFDSPFIDNGGTAVVAAGVTGTYSSLTVGLGSGRSGSLLISGGTLDGQNLYLGDSGTGTLTLSAGLLSQSGAVGIGLGGGTGTVLMSGGTLRAESVTVGALDGIGTMLVTGGRVETTGGTVGTRASGSSLELQGQETVWRNMDDFTFGALGAMDTLMTVESGALFMVGDSEGESVQFFGGGGDNYLRIDGGYVALYGDQTADVAGWLANGYVQMADGSSWTQAGFGDVQLTYYDATTEGAAAALAATGYQDLGGFTVLTIVPEPATGALLLLGGCALLRRSRKQR